VRAQITAYFSVQLRQPERTVELQIEFDALSAELGEVVLVQSLFGAHREVEDIEEHPVPAEALVRMYVPTPAQIIVLDPDSSEALVSIPLKHRENLLHLCVPWKNSGGDVVIPALMGSYGKWYCGGG
jgi:hypothetical protein